MTHAIKSKHRWHRTNSCHPIYVLKLKLRGMCLKWNLFIMNGHEFRIVSSQLRVNRPLHLYSFADNVMMASSWLVKVQFGHINNEIPRISNIGFDGNHHLYHACSKLRISAPDWFKSRDIWTNQMSPKIVSRDYLAFIEGFWNIFNLWATG